MTEKLIKAEFHCHTEYSPDSRSRLEDLLDLCRSKGIERLAITDHGTMDGAFRAKELDEQRIILAEEVQTVEGELLGYFMSEAIPQNLPVMEVINRMKKQGAFISIAHPFDPNRDCNWKAETLETIAPHLDGVEVFNSHCRRAEYNDLALAYAKKHNKLCLSGTDCHVLSEFGFASLTLPDFSSPDELRASLRHPQVARQLEQMQEYHRNHLPHW